MDHDHPDSGSDAMAVARGQSLFAAPLETASGTMSACTDCHAADGSGSARGPDVRESSADHLQEHAQGDAPMPVKYPLMTASDFADIAAFLLSECESAAECTPEEDEHHDDHDDQAESP